MKRNVSSGYIIFSIIIIVLLVLLLIFVNTSSVKLDDIDIIVKTTTTTAIEKDNKISVDINGTYNDYSIKTYVAYLGFKIDYFADFYTPSINSNKIFVLSSNENNKVFLKIEVLEYEDYMDQFNSSSDFEIDGYRTKFIFYQGNNLYVKVTENNFINNEDEMLDYMLNTLYIN